MRRRWGVQEVLCLSCCRKFVTTINDRRCPYCQAIMPRQYIDDYPLHPALHVPIFGETDVGKTVYLHALTNILAQMSLLWQGFVMLPATQFSRKFIADSRGLTKGTKVPRTTPHDILDCYEMYLHNSPWGSRTLIIRDVSGEFYKHFEFAQFDSSDPDKLRTFEHSIRRLVRMPIAIMMLRLPDLLTSHNTSEDLLENYFHWAIERDKNFGNEPRIVVVVLSQADAVDQLPEPLATCYKDDPIWERLRRDNPQIMSKSVRQEYIDDVCRNSQQIEKWIRNQRPGLLNLSAHYGVKLKFSVISSLGCPPVRGRLAADIAPQRVLEPFIWALLAHREHMEQQPGYLQQSLRSWSQYLIRRIRFPKTR